jgi:hypothetical protein
MNNTFPTHCPRCQNEIKDIREATKSYFCLSCAKANSYIWSEWSSIPNNNYCKLITNKFIIIRLYNDLDYYCNIYYNNNRNGFPSWEEDHIQGMIIHNIFDLFFMTEDEINAFVAQLLIFS